jgi:uncharacterized repeat protein (TIGR03803 family)
MVTVTFHLSVRLIVAIPILLFSLGSWALGQETVLYNFTGGADGGQPVGTMVLDNAGNLYGATEAGGEFNKGTVFMVTAAGQECVLHSFGAFNGDGEFPVAGVIFDSAGNLYGTTLGGGTQLDGTVFKLTGVGCSWVEQILYSFCSVGYPMNCNDGSTPEAALTLYNGGILLGTTTSGGGNGGANGVVFQLVPSGSGYAESVIYNFPQSINGAVPGSGLAVDSNGNLYGEVFLGGTGNVGLVYKLVAQSGGGWNYTVIFNFNGPNGGNALGDSVILDASGNLYGTTEGGGICGQFLGGCGVVYELSTNGNGGYNQTRLYQFAGGLDGALTQAGLTMDSSGNLYGSTVHGGGAGCGNGYGCGLDFELIPIAGGNWTEAILNGFNGTDGRRPEAGLTLPLATANHVTAQNSPRPIKRGCPGGCYGSTLQGGAYDQGVVYSLPSQ